MLQYRIMHDIIRPTLDALADDGAPFTGLLYAGLMLTAAGPKVVEFNCRFGDPETEALLPLLLSSLLDPVAEVARGGSLAGAPDLQWRIGSAVTTVVATAGYPAHPRTGDRLVLPAPEDNIHVFHGGTRIPEDAVVDPEKVPPIVSAGGRVLAVTAVAPTLTAAARKSREYAERVQLAGKQMRRDVAWRELARRRVLPSA